MKTPRVMIGMPIGSGSIPWLTAVSLMSTVRACDKAGVPIRIEAPVGCSVVQWARSAVVEGFLRSDSTHLFWIDSDIVWSPDDFFRLLGFGAVLDVVCATYPFKKDPPGVLINTVGKDGQYTVNGLGCVQIESAGLGFTLVKRGVLEALAATKPRVFDAVNNFEYADIFRVDRTAKGGPRGEDVAFFNDLTEMGYEVWLDPSIKLGHVGQKTYRADPIDALGLADFAKEIK